MRIDAALPYLKPSLPPDTGSDPIEMSEDDAPVMREFLAGLLTMYVVDTGDALQLVSGRDLHASSLSPDELHAAALRNLDEMLRAGVDVQKHGGVHAVLFGGNFEASLLHSEMFWAKAETNVGPDLLVCAPARDILAFGRAEAAIEHELTALVDRVWPGGDHLLTRDLLHRRGGVWHFTETN